MPPKTPRTPPAVRYSDFVSLVPLASGETRLLCRPHWSARLKDGTVGVQTAASARAEQGCEDCDQARLGLSAPPPPLR